MNAKSHPTQDHDNMENVVESQVVEMPTNQAQPEVINFNSDNSVYSGFATWAKVYAIIGFIYAGFTILAGIPYIIALGFGFLMIAAGVFYIIAYNKVLKVSNMVASLEKMENHKEFKATTVDILSNLKSYFKIISIIHIVTIISSIVLMILFFVFFAAAINSLIPSTDKMRNDPNLQPTINYR